jgi:hypothetical protein
VVVVRAAVLRSAPYPLLVAVLVAIGIIHTLIVLAVPVGQAAVAVERMAKT